MPDRMFDIRFDLLTFSANELFWYVSFFSLGYGDWTGSLFHWEKGHKIDVLFLRDAWHKYQVGEKIKGWFNDRSSN